MLWDYAWLVLWFGSGLVQSAGLALALWYGWRTSQAGWRAFWGAFVVNWLFTLAHHTAWGFATDLAISLSFLQGCMKLGAMLAEIVVMLIAQDLERNSHGRA